MDERTVLKMCIVITALVPDARMTEAIKETEGIKHNCFIKDKVTHFTKGTEPSLAGWSRVVSCRGLDFPTDHLGLCQLSPFVQQWAF